MPYIIAKDPNRVTIDSDEYLLIYARPNTAQWWPVVKGTYAECVHARAMRTPVRSSLGEMASVA